MKVAKCTICGNDFLASNNRQKTCSDSCRTIMQNDTKYEYLGSKIRASKHCSKCGQSFFPKHNACTICDACKVKAPNFCIECGTEFISNSKGGKQLCSDACKRARKTKTNIAYNKNRRKKPSESIKCHFCNKEFTPENSKIKFCSDNCRHDLKLQKANEKNIAIRKSLSVAKIEPIVNPETYLKPIETREVPQPVVLNKRNPKAEREAVLNMLELNRNMPIHDREVLRKKKIFSPDLSQMPFSVYDSKMKIRRFFRTEERYNHYLNNTQS